MRKINTRKFRIATRSTFREINRTIVLNLIREHQPISRAELARRMNVPSSSLQRELHDLTAAGILKTHRQGRMVYYQANTDSPIFSDLRGLMLKTAGLVDDMSVEDRSDPGGTVVTMRWPITAA